METNLSCIFQKDISTDERAKNFVKSLSAQPPILAVLTDGNKIGKSLNFEQFEEVVEDKKLLDYFQDSK